MVQMNAAMKYHRLTYIGPLLARIGARKSMATRTRPASASGSIQTGVSPHSRPCASPNKMPTAVLVTTTCQAMKMNQESLGCSTGRSVSRGMAQCKAPRKAFAMKP